MKNMAYFLLHFNI